jgi:hypothetical protein
MGHDGNCGSLISCNNLHPATNLTVSMYDRPQWIFGERVNNNVVGNDGVISKVLYQTPLFTNPPFGGFMQSAIRLTEISPIEGFEG